MCPADSNPPPTDPYFPYAVAAGSCRKERDPDAALVDEEGNRLNRQSYSPPTKTKVDEYYFLHVLPSSPQPQAVASPGCSQRATGREPTANPLGQKREPTSRTHFSRTHFPRTHANPLRTHLFREPTSRTHANPMRNTMVFPMRTHLQVGSRKVGSNRSGFEEKWVRVETIPNPLALAFRSGFGPPSSAPGKTTESTRDTIADG